MEVMASMDLSEQRGDCPVPVCPGLTQWKYVLPLPTPKNMGLIGARDLGNFYVVGEAWSQVISHFLPPEATVLDIGCGPGRTARFLACHPFIQKYVGFDCHGELIAFDQAYITPYTQGRFEFHHADLYSAHYNPSGTLNASEFRFPVEDCSVDLTFAASVFTHLLEPDARHYLHEICRVLRPRGKAILSIHKDPPPGQSFSGNEDRIDMRPEYFLQMAQEAGLKLLEEVGDLCGQETFVLTPA